VRPRAVLKSWIDQGKLPALHIGRRVRVRRADFNALIEQSAITRHEPESTPPSIFDGEIPLPVVPEDRS
jgi:excisionase family DNA binding protein